MRSRSEEMVRAAQDALCSAVGTIEGQPFHEDRWTRPGGGGGVSRVVQEGDVFEKAGVNVSTVHGVLPAEAVASMGGAAQLSEPKGPTAFFATGVSAVLHPRNPLVPTAHMNYRYFELGDPGDVVAWWFGGGADLTPAYFFEEDAIHFHRAHKEACDRFDPAFYPRFKRWCDDYFYIVHRGERRGVGGIFFDNLHDRPATELLDFCRACAAAFISAYVPLVERRKDSPFSAQQRRWQLLRRGRYVEFNLVYDRGTTFGLRTGGRIESILMSLPAAACWAYDFRPEPGSEEARLIEVLRTPRDWIT
jgi:coproporphyrinogen III oxidase